MKEWQIDLYLIDLISIARTTSFFHSTIIFYFLVTVYTNTSTRTSILSYALHDAPNLFRCSPKAYRVCAALRNRSNVCTRGGQKKKYSKWFAVENYKFILNYIEKNARTRSQHAFVLQSAPKLMTFNGGILNNIFAPHARAEL